MEFVLGMLFCIIAFIVAPLIIKDPQAKKQRPGVYYWLITSIIIFPVFLWGFIYSNNLLMYGQTHTNSQVEINLDFGEVEETSFLYLLENFDSTTRVNDVIGFMGTDFEREESNGYAMRYNTSKYTLGSSESSFITFTFDSRKDKILSIKWAHRDPSETLFDEELKYLEDGFLGKADTHTSSAYSTYADWKALHLEDTHFYLLFIRRF